MRHAVIKNIPNFITCIRVLGAVYLLFIRPFGPAFFIVYGICGISDVLDGYAARKLKCATRLGQTLDSIADLFFFGIVLFILIKAAVLPVWAVYCITGICLLRVLSLLAGFLKYRKPAFLHTFANKAAGTVLFFFPFLYLAFGGTASVLMACGAAAIAALEEFLINMTSKELSRDVKSIFTQKRNTAGKSSCN